MIYRARKVEHALGSDAFSESAKMVVISKSKLQDCFWRVDEMPFCKRNGFEGSVRRKEVLKIGGIKTSTALCSLSGFEDGLEDSALLEADDLFF